MSPLLSAYVYLAKHRYESWQLNPYLENEIISRVEISSRFTQIKSPAGLHPAKVTAHFSPILVYERFNASKSRWSEYRFCKLDLISRSLMLGVADVESMVKEKDLNKT